MLLSCSAMQAQNDTNDFGYSEPTETEIGKKLNLWSTQYYIHKFNSGGNIPIVYADSTQSRLYANTCDFCTAALEGTAYVTDSNNNVTVINYAKTGTKEFVDCRKCKKYKNTTKEIVEKLGKALWVKASGYGDGVSNYKLIPFRTIAVDKNYIPYGTVIYIPEVRGQIIELPDGKKVKHDGYFFAGDTGSAIKNNHVDIFTGIYTKNPFPDIIKSNKEKTFDAYIISNQEIISSLEKLHKKTKR